MEQRGDKEYAERAQRQVVDPLSMLTNTPRAEKPTEHRKKKKKVAGGEGEGGGSRGKGKAKKAIV